MLEKDPERWSDRDWRHARAVAAFRARFGAMRGPDAVGGTLTRKGRAKKLWGSDPLKK